MGALAALLKVVLRKRRVIQFLREVAQIIGNQRRDLGRLAREIAPGTIEQHGPVIPKTGAEIVGADFKPRRRVGFERCGKLFGALVLAGAHLLDHGVDVERIDPAHGCDNGEGFLVLPAIA